MLTTAITPAARRISALTGESTGNVVKACRLGKTDCPGPRAYAALQCKWLQLTLDQRSPGIALFQNPRIE